MTTLRPRPSGPPSGFTAATQPPTSADTEIFYPETDGMPLPDGEYQAPLYIETVGTLRVHFENLPNAHVNGNTLIYYREGYPQVRVSPDCYVVFDISMESIERNNNYQIWQVGKPPDFVLEIGSPSTARHDLRGKRDLYANLNIPEYWMHDATGGDFYGEPLIGLRLVEGEYRRIELTREPGGMVRGHSPILGLDLCWDDGRLRFYDPAAGEWLLDRSETKARAEAAEALVESERVRAESERARAESERVRAEAERVRAESAEARLAEMEAELRRLRGE